MKQLTRRQWAGALLGFAAGFFGARRVARPWSRLTPQEVLADINAALAACATAVRHDRYPVYSFADVHGVLMDPDLGTVVVCDRFRQSALTCSEFL
jgi:hypothetical protein